jgi:hypothetical protein
MKPGKKFNHARMFLAFSFTVFCTLTLFVHAAGAAEYRTYKHMILKDLKPWEWRGTDKMSVFGGNPGDVSNVGMDIVRECIDMKMTSNSKLDAMVNSAKSKDMIVILANFWYDHSDMGGGTSFPSCQVLGVRPLVATTLNTQTRIDGIVNRLRELGERYKGPEYSHVWIQPWNEPYWWDEIGHAEPCIAEPTEPPICYHWYVNKIDSIWFYEMDSLCSVIRSTGNENIIVVPGTATGQGFEVFITRGAELARKHGNIVFDVHCYDHKWYNWYQESGSQQVVTQDSIEQRFQDIHDAGVPVLVGEYANNGGGSDGSQSMYNVVKACRNKKVSLMAWLWGQYNSDLRDLHGGYCKESRNQNVEPIDITEIREYSKPLTPSRVKTDHIQDFEKFCVYTINGRKYMTLSPYTSPGALKKQAPGMYIIHNRPLPPALHMCLN